MNLNKLVNYIFKLTSDTRNFLLVLKNKNKIKQIFIGDSHASYIGVGKPHNLRIDIKGSIVVLYIGPRLMYSVASKGWKFTTLQKILIKKTPYIQKVICLGEIDVRNFLSKI